MTTSQVDPENPTLAARIAAASKGTMTTSQVNPEKPAGQRVKELTLQRNELFNQVKAHQDKVAELHHPSIEQTIKEFYNFFAGYTNYFWELPPDKIRGHDRTYESVLSGILDTTRESWEQLSLAINQRFNPVYRDDLAAADRIAEDFLERIRGIVYGMPLLYFEKSFQIRRHPYQTSPLLGISQERFRHDGKASLAHELGHHVFWNNGELQEYAQRLDFIAKEIARIILGPGLPSVNLAKPTETYRAIRSLFVQYGVWSGWIEEVFADVFGTLIAGPQFAKSAQDVLIRERVGRPSDLIFHDGVHPMPALRPLIALAVLQAIADLQEDDFKHELESLVQLLNARWQPIWDEASELERQNRSREAVSTFDHNDADSEPGVTLNELRNQVHPLVKMVLENAMFTTGYADAKQQQRLLDAVNYWGKSRSIDETKIHTLIEEFAQDPIRSIQERMSRAQADDAPRLERGGDDLFDWFLKFIQEREEKRVSEGGAPKEVWEAVLGFDLALEYGINHYNCQCSSGHSCHKHRSDGKSVPCS